LKNAQFPSQFHSWGFGIRAKWGGLYVGKGGISCAFRRSVLEGRFEILYDQKGSIGKGTVVWGGFGKYIWGDATREQWKSWKSLKLHSMGAKDGITSIFLILGT